MFFIRIEGLKAEQLALFGGATPASKPRPTSAPAGQLDLFGGDPTHGGHLVERVIFTKAGHQQTFHVLPVEAPKAKRKAKPAIGPDLFAWADQATPSQVASALVDAHQQAKRPEATPEDIERRDQLLTAAQAHQSNRQSESPEVAPLADPTPTATPAGTTPEDAPAGTIFHGYTSDYSTQIQWAKREDGQWFRRGQDKTPRGYRWSGWVKGGPPNERASIHGSGNVGPTRMARLPQEGGADEAMAGAKIIPNRHTKTGEALWTVQLQDRVSSETYQEILAHAKGLGGRYSSFRGNGAIPGFIFKTEDAARAFTGQQAEEEEQEATEPAAVNPPVSPESSPAETPEAKPDAVTPTADQIRKDPTDGGRLQPRKITGKDGVTRTYYVSQDVEGDVAAKLAANPDFQQSAKVNHRDNLVFAIKKTVEDMAADEAVARNELGHADEHAKGWGLFYFDGLDQIGRQNFLEAVASKLAQSVRDQEPANLPSREAEPAQLPDPVAEPAETVKYLESAPAGAQVTLAHDDGRHVWEKGEKGWRPEGAPDGPPVTDEGLARAAQAGAAEIVDGPAPADAAPRRTLQESLESFRQGLTLTEDQAKGDWTPQRMSRAHLVTSILDHLWSDKTGPSGEPTDDMQAAMTQAAEAEADRIIAETKKPRVAKPEATASGPKANTQSFGRDLTPKQRKDANSSAVEIIQRAVSQGRELTQKEMDEVALYSGRGGIGDSLNQYFTRPDIAASMWDLLAHHGLAPDAKVLEPACGSGVFMQTAPEGVTMTAVEIDPEVALVASSLHGARHTVHAQSFEEFAVARERGVGDRFDAVITNAPFCTRTGDGARIHKPEYTSADAYFVDTALDQVKEGGLVAMIVHRGVMSNDGMQEFRRRIGDRAELVDAFRLPVEAFKHADTTVVSDVIILRKRPEVVATALARGGEEVGRALGVNDEDLIYGRWFDDKPDRVLGTVGKDWRGSDLVEGSADACAPLIRARGVASWAHGPAGKTITAEEMAAHSDERVRAALDAAKADVAIPTPVRGSQTVIAGKTYILTPGESGALRWRRLDSIDDARELLHSGDAALKSAGDLALRYGDLRSAMARGDYLRARGIRRKLQKDLNAWVENYGVPARHPEINALAGQDANIAHLVAAVNPDKTMADILTSDPVIPPAATGDRAVPATSVSEAASHLATHNPGQPITVAKLREAFPSTAEDDEIVAGLVESGEYVDARGAFGVESDAPGVLHADDYASGDLFALRDHEFEQAASEDDATRQRAEARLALVQRHIDERWRPLDQVEVSVRSGWIPPHVIEAWLNSPDVIADWHKASQFKVTEAGGVYTVSYFDEAKGKRVKHSGEPDHVPARNILRYMNRLPLHGERARDEAEAEDEKFRSWLASSDLRGDVEEIYNRRFTGQVPRRLNSTPMKIDGLQKELWPYHYEQIRWNTDRRGGIVAMDVGLGKTFNTIATARQMRVTGQARKVAVTCPKSVIINWSKEIEDLHPGAKVMIVGATSKEKPKKTWRDPTVPEYVAVTDNDETLTKKLADIAANDYDLVLFTYEAQARIPVRDDNVTRFEGDDFWSRRASKLSDSEATVAQSAETRQKKLAQALASYQAERAKLGFNVKQSIIHWEDLGIDTMFVDEAHNFANLGSPRSRGGQVKMMGSSSDNVKRAHDLQLKAALVRERRKPDETDDAYQRRMDENKEQGLGVNGNGVFMLTATPAKNSPMDVYHLMLQATPQVWREVGVRNLEEFIDRYVDIEERPIINTEQKAEMANCAVGFKNLIELRAVMERGLRRRTAKEVNLKVPQTEREEHLVDMTPQQHKAFRDIRDEFERRKLDKDERVANSATLWLLHQLNAAGTDLSLLSDEHPEHAGEWRHSPKYHEAVGTIVKNLKSGRGGQVVFIDRNASHTHMKNLLVEAGIPESEIEILNATTAADADKRYAVSERFNLGKTRVVIGNTGTMGEGVNLQKNTSDLHHLDLPWSPGKYHQREGRAVRQGNKYGKVRIHTYFSKRSFDSYRHAILSGKQGWVSNLYSGGDYAENTEEGEDFSPEELQIMLADDPDEARKVFEANKGARVAALQDAARAKAMRDWQGVIKRRSALAKMADKTSHAARRLEDTIRLDTARLKRVTELPKPLRAALDSDLPCVAVPTTGAIIKVGDVILPKNGNVLEDAHVVTDVDPVKGAVSIRPFGRKRPAYYGKHTLTAAELPAYVHHEGPETEADAYRPQVREKLAAAAKFPTLAGHDLAEMRDWPEAIRREFEPEARQIAAAAVSHVNPYGHVFVRHGDTVKAVRGDSPEAKNAAPLLPWGEDREAILRGLVTHLRTEGKKQVVTQGKRGSMNYTGRYEYQPSYEWKNAHARVVGGRGDDYGLEQEAIRRIHQEDQAK
jgi:predicted RNA methylase